MIAGISLKVCGLTSLADSQAAAAIGADYLGFIFYPRSPRCISETLYRALAPRLPSGHKVAVCVEPAPTDLARLAELGFDFFQVHFQVAEAPARVAAWSGAVGPSRLWLAPKLPPGRGIDPAWLPLADTFLIDTFAADKFGGTGLTGDWAGFRRRAAAHPKHRWILSGGLSQANIAAALAATGARMVDVNSGVERAPGVKDPAKLGAFAEALRAAAGRASRES